MERPTMGKFLRELRLAYGMTQHDLAERLSVTDKSVSRWERDETAPDLATVPLLAEIFAVSADELLQGRRRDHDAGDQTERRLLELRMKSIRHTEKISDDGDRLTALYDLFHEESRLTRSQAARVEFLTTLRYVERYLRPGMKLLELGAGTGEYSRYFAQNGYDVTAVDLAQSNLDKFRERMTPESSVDLRLGDARDLSQFADETFDVVLVLGPLYHLFERKDQLLSVKEAMRVCKTGGILYFAFISNDMVIATELSYRPGYFREGEFDRETFHLHSYPFCFHTIEEAESLLEEGGVRLLHAVAADGLSELMEPQINGLSPEDYREYLRYHFYCCEKREHLGRSNHLLYVGKKG